MVREADHGGGVTLSSIALLQERFKQLQKMKELRQEKELLRTISESERYSPPTIIPLDQRHSTRTSSTTFSGSEQSMFLPPPSPHCQLSLSLRPDSQTKHAELWAIKAQSSLAKSLFSTDSPSEMVCTSPPFKLESCDVDIDTSLRL